MAECDVIEQLQRKFFKLEPFVINCVMMPYFLLKGRNPAFDHILEKIFEQLDYACLKQAAMVSPIWSEAVSKSKVYWKQTFFKNVSLS